VITRLPRWVWFGGALLALLGGMINAVGFLSFQHQGVTHLTGTTTLVGITLAQGDLRRVLSLSGVIVAFLFGAAFSGFIVKDSTLQLGRRYGAALVAESAFLFAAVPLLRGGHAAGAMLASCACGLQNGMVSTYSGAVVRTTHVSGIMTDLGIVLGQKARGVTVDRRRIFLCSILYAAFLSGAAVGALVFARFAYGTLYVPAVVTGAAGTGYAVYRHFFFKAA
jgi:uncharacterized membrane protein YoaK (UPF0700 family)